MKIETIIKGLEKTIVIFDSYVAKIVVSLLIFIVGVFVYTNSYYYVEVAGNTKNVLRILNDEHSESEFGRNTSLLCYAMPEIKDNFVIKSNIISIDFSGDTFSTQLTENKYLTRRYTIYDIDEKLSIYKIARKIDASKLHKIDFNKFLVVSKFYVFIITKENGFSTYTIDIFHCLKFYEKYSEVMDLNNMNFWYSEQ